MSKEWIAEVKASSLSLEKKVELLQNEFIFRYQLGDKKNAALISAELRGMNAKVLASLDLKDANGIYPTAPVAQPQGQPARADAYAVPPAAVGQVNQIEPVDHNDERVSREFAALGNMYQIGDFILSGLAPQKMNQRDAVAYCQRLGAELPSREQLEAVARAIGAPNANNRNLILDMAGDRIWSSSVHPNCPALAYTLFDDGHGTTYYSNRFHPYSFWCVRPAAVR